MRFKLLVFFIIIYTASYAQMNPATIVLKSGVTIKAFTGKLTAQSIKYKETAESDFEEAAFSEIEYAKIQYSDENIRKYKFFKIIGDQDYKAVEQLTYHGKVQLYAVNTNVASSVGQLTVNNQMTRTILKKKRMKV